MLQFATGPQERLVCDVHALTDFLSNCGSFLSGHVEVVKLLLSHSADVMSKDKRGYTPLHAAAASGQLDVVKYLMRLVVEVKCLIAAMDYIFCRSCEVQPWPDVINFLHISWEELLCLPSDWWTQRFWEHGSPHGLLHRAGQCGHWAGELWGKHQSGQPPRQHAAASGCRLLQRGAVSRAAHQQWCWCQRAGKELIFNKWFCCLIVVIDQRIRYADNEDLRHNFYWTCIMFAV